MFIFIVAPLVWFLLLGGDAYIKTISHCDESIYFSILVALVSLIITVASLALSVWILWEAKSIKQIRLEQTIRNQSWSRKENIQEHIIALKDAISGNYEIASAYIAMMIARVQRIKLSNETLNENLKKESEELQSYAEKKGSAINLGAMLVALEEIKRLMEQDHAL